MKRTEEEKERWKVWEQWMRRKVKRKEKEGREEENEIEKEKRGREGNKINT